LGGRCRDSTQASYLGLSPRLMAASLQFVQRAASASAGGTGTPTQSAADWHDRSYPVSADEAGGVLPEPPATDEDAGSMWPSIGWSSLAPPELGSVLAVDAEAGEAGEAGAVLGRSPCE